jgi:hypothetical protein
MSNDIVFGQHCIISKSPISSFSIRLRSSIRMLVELVIVVIFSTMHADHSTAVHPLSIKEGI